MIWLIAGIAAVTVVGGGALWWATTRPASAEDAAEAYLSALESGDVDAIRAQVASAEGPDTSTLEAFTGAAEYVTDARIEKITTGPQGTTGVAATAVFDGERRDVSFVMERVDEVWSVTGDFLGTLDVTSNLGDSVWIGGVLAPTGAPTPLLPAVYAVQVAPFGALTGEESVAVDNAEPLTVALDASLSPDATPLAQEQLDAYADACAATSEAVAAHCGLRVPWAADLTTLTSISYRIETHPHVTLASDGARFDATAGVIVATATGTPREGTATSFTYRADDWVLRGDLVFHGNELTLAVY